MDGIRIMRCKGDFSIELNVIDNALVAHGTNPLTCAFVTNVRMFFFTYNFRPFVYDEPAYTNRKVPAFPLCKSSSNFAKSMN